MREIPAGDGIADLAINMAVTQGVTVFISKGPMKIGCHIKRDRSKAG
jgi:hypothetical protein